MLKYNTTTSVFMFNKHNHHHNNYGQSSTCVYSQQVGGVMHVWSQAEHAYMYSYGAITTKY